MDFRSPRTESRFAPRRMDCAATVLALALATIAAPAKSTGADRTPLVVKTTSAASVADFNHLVRTGNWIEQWPDATGGGEARSVKGGVWNDAIEAALQNRGAAFLPKRGEPYYLDRPIRLKSNQRLVADPQAEIRLLPNVNTCMVRNEHVLGFADRPVTGSLTPDTNIVIEGGIWTTLATGPRQFNGNLRGRSALQSDVPGCHGVILLQNARHVRVRNVTIRQSRAFAVHLGNVRDFVVEGVRLDRHGRDGVHVNGPASNGVIRDVSGDSGDDPVSLCAWDWRNYAPSFGAIHNILIEHVKGAPPEKRATDAIRLLPGVKLFADGTKLDCPIHDVTLRDITDIRDFKQYNQPNLELGRDKDASAGIGRLGNILFEKLRFTRPGSIQVHADVDGLRIQDVQLEFVKRPEDLAKFKLVEIGPQSATYKHGSTDPAHWVEIFSPDLDCTVRHLTITGVRTAGSPTEIPTGQLVRVIQQRPNSDYPRTTPRGGTGKGLWLR